MELFRKWISIGLKIGCVLILERLSLEFTLIVARNKDNQIKKYKSYYNLLCKWNDIQSEKLGQYFEENNIQRVAIYGLGKMSELFYKQMRASQIDILYFVDKSACVNTFSSMPIYKPMDTWPKADALVVIPYPEIKSIEEICTINNNIKIISLEEIINAAANY